MADNLVVNCAASLALDLWNEAETWRLAGNDANYQACLAAYQNQLLISGVTDPEAEAVVSVPLTSKETTERAKLATAFGVSAITEARDSLAAAVLMDRLRNNLAAVADAKLAIQLGQLFADRSVAEKAFLTLVCDEIDALARLTVQTFVIVD